MKQQQLYFTTIAIALLLSSLPLEAKAQRLVPRQKGITLSVGTNSIDKSPFEEGAITTSLDFSQYFRHYNYYFFGLEYNQRNYYYQEYPVPSRHILFHAGYMHPVASDYTKTFMMYLGASGVGGYHHLDVSDDGRTFPNGATLVNKSSFVGGCEARTSIELLITNNLILQISGKGMFLWGTSLNLFYPSASIGFKYNF